MSLRNLRCLVQRKAGSTRTASHACSWVHTSLVHSMCACRAFSGTRAATASSEETGPARLTRQARRIPLANIQLEETALTAGACPGKALVRADPTLTCRARREGLALGIPYALVHLELAVLALNAHTRAATATTFSLRALGTREARTAALLPPGGRAGSLELAHRAACTRARAAAATAETVSASAAVRAGCASRVPRAVDILVFADWAALARAGAAIAAAHAEFGGGA